MKSILTIALLGLILSSAVWARDVYSLKRLTNEKMVTAYLPVINQDIAKLELGFLTEKNLWKYPFQAFVNGFLMDKRTQFSETGAKTDKSEYNDNPHAKVSVGALGVKAGVLLPTNTLFGLSLLANFGWGKIAIHPDPWFGRNDATVEKKELWLYELGYVLNYEQYYIIMKRTVSNRRYFTDEYFFGLGSTF